MLNNSFNPSTIKKYKMNSETMFKIILLLISSSGLIFQVQIIYHQFMSGKTIVSIEIGRRHKQTLLAITLCLPELFSMERSAKYDPAFTKINETYNRIYQNSSRNAIKFYGEIFKNYTDEKLINNGLDMNELFDKMSVKFKALNGKPILRFSLYGNTDNKSIPGDFISYIRKIENEYRYVGDPFESIVIRSDEEKRSFSKCFTFFSSAQEKWRNFHTQMRALPLRFNWETIARSFPLFNYRYYYFSIHSPNHLPVLDTNQEFLQVNIEDVTKIKYSELRIERLGKGYDTDCHSFESDTNFSYYRMGSDCLNDCYQDKLRKICKDESSCFMSNHLLKQGYFQTKSDKIKSYRDREYNDMSLKIELDCVQMCKVECNFNYHSFEIERSESEHRALFIRHSESPDVFVCHVPEIILMAFVCSFGGLLGMWLGLSLFAIFNNIFYLINKVVNSKKINYNVNVHVHRPSINGLGNFHQSNPLVRIW